MAAHQEHHYVPESYFKPWCGHDGKMTYFHWANGKFLCRRTSPRSAARQTLLYALPGAPKNQVVTLESEYFAKQVDDPGAVILRLIIENDVDTLSLDQRHIWTRYLMALHARRPEVIEMARKVGRETLQNSLRKHPEEYEALRAPNHPKTLEEWVEPWIKDNFGMLNIPAIIDHDETRATIMAMHWWRYDFQYATNDLLTGDRPLIWARSSRDQNFFLALPLTPRQGFFATKSVEVKAKLLAKGPTELARKFNLSEIGQSAGYIYASHDGHAKFVKSHLKKSNGSGTN